MNIRIVHKYSKKDNRNMFFIQSKFLIFLWWKDMTFLHIVENEPMKMLTYKYKSLNEAGIQLRKLCIKFGFIK